LAQIDDRYLAADAIAETNINAALNIARKITDLLVRSRTLSWIARFGPDSYFDRIITEARMVGLAAADVYVHVVSACWYIRALIECDKAELADADLRRVILCLDNISHPLRRMDATYLLFQAVFPVERHRLLVLPSLISACAKADSWRSPDTLREAAIMLAFGGHRLEADEVLDAMPVGKHRRQAINRIVRRQRREPYPFFW